MKNEDVRMAERFGISPIITKMLDDKEISSLEEFLIKFWETKKYSVSIDYDNPRAYIPQVCKMPNSIKIIVCSKKHPSDYKLQLAVFIVKSIKGDYDNLPSSSASDEELILNRAKPINDQEAQNGKYFLKWLSKKYEIK